MTLWAIINKRTKKKWNKQLKEPNQTIFSIIIINSSPPTKHHRMMGQCLFEHNNNTKPFIIIIQMKMSLKNCMNSFLTIRVSTKKVVIPH